MTWNRNTPCVLLSCTVLKMAPATVQQLKIWCTRSATSRTTMIFIDHKITFNAEGQSIVLPLASMTEFKVVMVGDQGVGKTSITTKFVRPSLPFQDRLPMTIAYGEYNERLQLKGKSILLQIVDTSGQYNTTSSLPQLYRGAHGAAVIFDVGSWDSLVSVRQWVSMVREKCGYEIPIILVGNKTDSESREVNFETAENVRDEFNLFYIEVSAKTGVNIEETFSVLTEQLMQQRDLRTASSSSSSSSVSSLPSISPRRYEPPARITAREQVPLKRIEKDPDSISLKQGDKNGNRSSSSRGDPATKKRSCCSS